jgi:hypothetical protein
VDDPDLLKQGQADIALCRANLDAGVVDQGGRDCMAKKGYALVPKDQAEQAPQDTPHQQLSVPHHLLPLIDKRGFHPGARYSRHLTGEMWHHLQLSRS